MQNRLKSWTLWLAIAALIVFVWKEVSGVDITNVVNGLLNVLLPVVAGLGIVNNPTDPNKL